jgi:hypothetical protein
MSEVGLYESERFFDSHAYWYHDSESRYDELGSKRLFLLLKVGCCM